MNCISLRDEVERFEEENRDLSERNDMLKQENEQLKGLQYNYENVSQNKEHFEKSTGIALDKFHSLYKLVNPGVKCENLKFYKRHLADAKPSSQSAQFNAMDYKCKPGPKPKFDSIDQLFMVLVWMRNGFPLSHLAWIFSVPKATISRYLISWVNYLYYTLGSIPIWPTREQVNGTKPDSFKSTYPTTRCVIDSTELFCQVPSSLITQSALYSHYKHHVTYKGLVGISPSGAVTFVSQLYDGSTSDKEIVRRCGILTKELWEEGDSLMADRGFEIEEDLAPLKVSLNIPAFLRARDQLDKDEVCESQTIAAVRIHVERAIQRIKRFKIIRNEIGLTMHGSINQIWTVACLLTNLMPPLIQKDAAKI